MNYRRNLLLLLCLSLPLVVPAQPSITDTRLLSEPAISADRIAFIYANDLWTCDLSGKNVRRLTSDIGVESSPAFSPDGKLLAFSAQYEGNTDVYIVSADGGIPKRLTWHPGADIVQGFAPDGKSVLFTSPRAVYTSRYTQLYTVSIAGGPEEALPIPHSDRAVFSPDGKRIAYNPLGPRFLQWKGYRGGTVSQIWLYERETHAIEKISQPASRANDAGPMWIGDHVYFRSDRDGEFNLWSYDIKSRALKRLTNHTDFPVLNASAGGGRIVYEQAGYLHLFDPAKGTAQRLVIAVAADLPETRQRFAKETADRKYIRDVSISPNGVRVAMEFRGEIVTVPAEKGDVRNLTNSTGVHEHSPVWSPDGASVAYFSDDSGEYQLVIEAQDGKGTPKKYKLSGAGYYEFPAWSPDSKKIAYVDNARTLFWLDVASGAIKKVAADYFYGPVKYLRPSWSPDSQWIAYAANNQAYINRVYVYSLEQDKALPITDGLSDATEPVFDRSGKYLYFLSSTDAGPINNWFSLETNDLKITRSIWLAVLGQDLPNPLVKESDEEKAASAPDDKDKKDKEAGPVAQDEKEKPTTDKTDTKSDEKPKKAEPVKPVKIDFDGLANRIIDVPVPVAEIEGLQAGPEGQIFFVRTADEKHALQRFDLKDRKTETMLPDIGAYQISSNGKKIAYRVKEEWAVAGTGGKKIDPSEAKTLKTSAIEVRVDPRAEWKEMFDEAWRINRDFFYDPNMHGVAWQTVREKYAAFLPDLATRHDLNRLLRWMLSELGVGHSTIPRAGDIMETKAVAGGLLGADYAIENGRYKFIRVYGGLNWNPKLRSPLTEPGVNVKAGEYLLSVGGRDVRPPANLYSFFENTAGKLIEITVGTNADGAGARTVSVVPIENEQSLRNRDWVEANVRKVEAATGGRVAYVYVPDTANQGYAYFKRYFYPQAHKDAIILDERFNSGGSLADYYIDLVSKKMIAYWAMRYGPDMKTPSASIQGPRVLLADESAGSGGDLLPWMWRKFAVGPIVGTRTWGGLVGVLGFPPLMDGGVVTAPNLAFFDPEKGWAVENEGVPPDIEVEMTPADVIAGKDPQLERAIAIVLDGLQKHPPTPIKRPSYPVKTINPAAMPR